MSKFDIFLIVVAVIGAVQGYIRGFVLSFFGIVALVAASFCSLMAMQSLIDWLKHRYSIDTEILPFLAFSIGFILIFIVVKLLGHYINKSLEKTAFAGAFDKPLGAFFGALKIMFWVSLLFWLISTTHVIDLKSYTKESTLYASVAKFAPGLAKWAATWFPFLHEVFKN